MAYGDYDGPDKPNKGKEGGACNRTLCQAEPALYYNHGSYAWYCADCAVAIEYDPVNKRNWDARWRPECGHDMFETRAMMDARMAEIDRPIAMMRDAQPAQGITGRQLMIQSTPMRTDNIGHVMYGVDLGTDETMVAVTMQKRDGDIGWLQGVSTEAEWAEFWGGLGPDIKGKSFNWPENWKPKQTPATRRRAKLLAQRVGRR